ncbi:hypothetical protein D9613_006138 [Agrocybe pediades]|uniref:Uncharacterized protein n=1 Tax=Agrocybe pediades TaxID=84607 RepID=A0A8H4QVB0_9AGAR|nr:hypothetical protein D9613_006138 [Agrocybe pediades]
MHNRKSNLPTTSPTTTTNNGTFKSRKKSKSIWLSDLSFSYFFSSNSHKRSRTSTLNPLPTLQPWLTPSSCAPSPIATVPFDSHDESYDHGRGHHHHHHTWNWGKQMPVGNEPHPGKQSMQATVSALHKSAFGGGGSTFADFGLRRRRSTGGGTASGRSGLFSKDKDGKEKKDKSRMSTSGQGGFHGISSSNAVSSSSPISLTGGISSANYADGLPAATNGNEESSSQPQFSTADRKILAQLKVNQQALDAQFKIKGFGHMVFGSAKSKGKKYHTHPKEEVPYPRSYDREVLDL